MRSFAYGMRMLAVCCLLAAPAVATSVMPVNAVQAVDQAELIFTGQVLDVEFVPTRDGKFPFTFVTFSVDETLKGSADANFLTLRFDGGDLPTAEESIEVVGVPMFTVGEEVLLFVAGNGKRACPLIGWWQGRLDIVAHPTSGERLLVDHLGAPIEGVEQSQWRRADVRYDASEKSLISQEPQAQLLWQEGVTIVDEGDAPTKAYAGVTASKVLDDLRSLVEKRRAEKSFTPSRVVSSASPLDVPESVQFTATYR